MENRSSFRFIFRLLIAVVFGIPTIWILYLAFTCMGIFLVIPVVGIIAMLFNFALGNKEAVQENMEMVKLGGYLMIAPFIFWYFFIVGKNPFTEMGI